MKPKNKDHTNFYECCDLTKKVYLTYSYILLNHLKTFSDNDDNGLYHLLEEQVFTFEFHPTFSPKNFCLKFFIYQ